MFLVLFLGLLVLVLEVEDVKLQVGHLHPGGLLQGVQGYMSCSGKDYMEHLLAVQF